MPTMYRCFKPPPLLLLLLLLSLLLLPLQPHPSIEVEERRENRATCPTPYNDPPPFC